MARPGLPHGTLSSGSHPHTDLATAPGESAPLGTTRGASGLMLLGLLPLVVILLLWFLPLDSREEGARPDPRSWSLDAPLGPRSTPPFTLVVGLDESASTAESDRNNNRGTQVRLLLEWLRIWGAPDDRIAVVRFGDRALGWGPEPVSAAPGHLPGGDVGTGTAFTPVLADIADRIGQAPSERNVVVLLTDGQGEDPKPALRRLPVPTEIFVLGLDDDGAWTSASKDLWKGALTGSWRLRNLTQAEIAKPLAGLLTRLTGQDVQARPNEVTT